MAERDRFPAPWLENRADGRGEAELIALLQTSAAVSDSLWCSRRPPAHSFFFFFCQYNLFKGPCVPAAHPHKHFYSFWLFSPLQSAACVCVCSNKNLPLTLLFLFPPLSSAAAPAVISSPNAANQRGPANILPLSCSSFQGAKAALGSWKVTGGRIFILPLWFLLSEEIC